MNRKLARLAALILLLVQAQFCVLAAETDRGFLWRIDGGAKPSYLLGSIHLAPASLHPLPGAVQRAFEQAEVLVVEADVVSLDPASISPFIAREGMYPAGRTLRDEFPAAEWAELEKLLRQLQLSPLFLLPQKPWLAQTTLTALVLMGEGFSQEYGIDVHLLNRARGAGKPVRELESVAMQLSLLASLPPDLQRRMFAASVRELARGESSGAAFVKAWRGGDTQLLARVMAESFDSLPQVKEALLTRRNHAMADKLVGWLQDGRSHLVTVGAGHTVGDEGLVELLRRAGFTLTQL